MEIAGKPLIVHTAERAREAATVDEVIVATDDERIEAAVRAYGFAARMTSPDLASGSDRVAAVAAELPEGSVIVNLQGDEPVISPATIDRAVKAIMGGGGERADIVTTCEPIGSIEELENPNVVKVVTNAEGRALYFSRSPIPYIREAATKFGMLGRALAKDPELLGHFKKHTGLYVYGREFLLEYTKMPQTTLEKLEMLEQLRALENGAYIKVVEAAGRSIGVDTEEDLAAVRGIFEADAAAEEIAA